MSVINLGELSITRAGEMLHSGKVSARELVSMYLSEIEKENKGLNSYLEVFSDGVFAEAEKIDDHLKRGDQSLPLSGAFIAVKDNILIRGKTVSASSKILENYKASYDATVIKKLKEAGAVFLGRTNMDEFAMGSSTENSAYGPTKNPYDRERVPGGSSGGSAAAVASGLAVAALGSDTGGSIRQPAAFCGTVGLKPTYGAVSRSGLIAMASSLDQIGPITRTVRDAETIFNIIRGKDILDATSVEYPENKINKLSPIIGIPREYGLQEGFGMDKDVKDKFYEAVNIFKEHGYNIKDVSLRHTEYALAVYYIIMPAELSSNLARFDGVRYGLSERSATLLDTYINSRIKGFGTESKRRIMLGAHVLSAGYYDAYYARAQKVRTLIKKDFENVFREVDVLMTPTTPTPAFKLGEKTGDPLSMYLSDIFTVPANLSGVPAMSMPFGKVERDGKKLPVGIQLISPWFCEQSLFDAGKFLEKFND